MPKLDEQISTLQQRLQQLKVRQQRIDARQRALAGVRERKADLRRKVIVGGLVLDKMRDGALDREPIVGWLDQMLTRTADRALFDLPPVAPPGPAAADAADETRAATES